MKSKRVLELREFEEQHKQRKLEFEKAAAKHIEHLRSELEKAEEALVRYVEQEFEHYVKRRSTHVNNVYGCMPKNYILIEFNNGCRLSIPPRDKRVDAELLWKRRTCIIMSMDETTSNFAESYAIDDRYFNKRLVACAAVFGDAVALVREAVPHWFDVILPELDAELLMTTRVLRWISKQIGGQWPDVVSGHVVDKIQ